MIHFSKTQAKDIEEQLAHQKKLSSGTYNLDTVINQLDLDFRRKCYICEDKVKSIRIEHFRPQCLGIDEKFNWYNIFNACEHCNAIKSDYFRNLIDCTKEYPDQHIRFEVVPLNPIGQQVVLTKTSISTIHNDTIDLLNAVYRGTEDLAHLETNKRKQIESESIVEDLLEELNDLDDLIKDYLAERDPDDLLEITDEVNNSSKFTAFKRWFVKNNSDYNHELIKYFED
ncbi:hypothetical protein [Vibrio splendidus]|uniref:hypothetical protein n=1 Tax=Vibrio splendidus TaxID=29497 RepID=UPI000CAB52BA|nr:hypothetical protein [Vibrio splendidus]PMH19199.1 hypothetical protein BCU77_21275 [Vibrio splendidus]